jgi:hypothetical protein
MPAGMPRRGKCAPGAFAWTRLSNPFCEGSTKKKHRLSAGAGRLFWNKRCCAERYAPCGASCLRACHGAANAPPAHLLGRAFRIPSAGEYQKEAPAFSRCGPAFFRNKRFFCGALCALRRIMPAGMPRRGKCATGAFAWTRLSNPFCEGSTKKKHRLSAGASFWWT